MGVYQEYIYTASGRIYISWTNNYVDVPSSVAERPTTIKPTDMHMAKMSLAISGLVQLHAVPASKFLIF